MRERGQVRTALKAKPTWIAQLDGRIVGGDFDPIDPRRGGRVENDGTHHALAGRQPLRYSEHEPGLVRVRKCARVEHADDTETGPAWTHVAWAEEWIRLEPVR